MSKLHGIASKNENANEYCALKCSKISAFKKSYNTIEYAIVIVVV